MTKQRNKFANFLLALIFPGAGHMFMGFLKRGISFAAYTALSIALSMITEMSVFFIPIVLVPVYAFFDAMQLNWLPEEEFAGRKDAFFLPGDSADSLVSSAGFHRVVGYGILFIGILGLWSVAIAPVVYTFIDLLPEEASAVAQNILDMIPGLAVSAAAILVGLRLIRGKKAQIASLEAQEDVA